MSSFHILSTTVTAQGGCVEAVVQTLRLASGRKDLEEGAAVKIQSIARMRAQRQRYLRILKHVVDVQRLYRGYLGRKQFLERQIDWQRRFNKAVFDHFASLIQSRFRGYLLRKKHCDFYARKRYIQHVTDRGETVRKQALEYFTEQQQIHEETQRRSQLEEFKKATHNLHHLLSTASISGVYRPPLSIEGCKTVFGTNMEDDLRAVAGTTSTVKRKFKPDLPVSSTAITTETKIADVDESKASQRSTAGTTIAPPLVPHAPVGLASVSLQNSRPYQIERESESLAASVDKRLQDAIHKGAKFLARKTDAAKFGSTIAAGSQYVERSAIAPRKR